MKCLALFLFISYLGISKIKRVFKSISFYKYTKKDLFPIQKSSEKVKFTILIPCLNELNNIKKIINHFERISRKNINLVFVISAKSKDISDVVNFLNTLDKVNIKHLIIPIPFTINKATQVNYALKKLNLKNPRQYIVIYDADSRPDLNTFVVAEHFIKKNNFPKVLQQPSIFNYQGTFIQQIDGLFQTLWGFHHEIFYWSSNFYSKKVKHLIYLIGHGLFIRSDYFIANPLPNTNIEDILYGYSLCLRGEIPIILPVFDYAGTPKNLKEFIKQKAKWYIGVVKAFCVSFKNNHFKNIFLLSKRLLWDMEWGFINLLILLFCILFCNTILIKIVTIIFWIILYYFIPLTIFYIQGKKLQVIKNEFSFFQLLIFSFTYYLLYNTGPLIGILTFKLKREANYIIQNESL